MLYSFAKIFILSFINDKINTKISFMHDKIAEHRFKVSLNSDY